MKKFIIILFFVIGLCIFTAGFAVAQCSICTKTAQQLGEQPAKGLNTGIIYLAAIPYITVGFIAYRWWKRNGSQQTEA